MKPKKKVLLPRLRKSEAEGESQPETKNGAPTNARLKFGEKNSQSNTRPSEEKKEPGYRERGEGATNLELLRTSTISMNKNDGVTKKSGFTSSETTKRG